MTPADAAALKRSSDELAAIFANASIGILFTRELIIQRCNPRAAEMLGYENEQELVGKPAVVLYPDQESCARMRREAGPALGASKSFHADWLLKKRDGNAVWCSVFGKAIDPQHADLGIVWMLEDITEAKKTRSALEHGEKLLEYTFSHIDQGISIVDAGLNLLSVNQRFMELLDFPPSLCCEGSRLADIFRYNAERGDYGPGDVQEQVRSRIELALRFEPHQFQRERPDGSILEIRGRPIPGGGFITVYTDVTKQVKAEHALRESELFFRESQRAAFIGSYKFDFQKDSWESSEVLDHIFGIDASYGRNLQGWANLVHPDDAEMMNKHLAQEVVAQHKPFNKEYRIVRKSDGETRWVIGLGQASFKSDGTPALLAGTIQDITQRKQQEKLQKALFDISEASHSSADLPSLLQNIHQIVGDLIPAKNFYVALYDEASEQLSFPYFVDEYDAPPAPKKLSDTGLTDKVIRSGQALLLTPEVLVPVNGQRHSYDGAQCKAWMGVPLKAKGRTMGVLAVNSYSDLVLYSEPDKALLEYVSSHVAATLERTLAEQSLTEAHRELTAREILLKQILDTASVAIFLLDMTGRITKANRRMAEMFFWSVQELEGMEYVALVEPSERAMGREKMLALLSSQISSVDLDRSYVRADGSHFFGHLSGKRFCDADGQELGLIGVIADISERRLAQESLQLAASVFTHAREGIMITDGAGTLIEVNETFSLITGYSREEAIGQNPRMLQSGRQSPEFYATMWQDLAEKGHWYGELWNRRKNGQVYAQSATISAVRDALGKTQNYVALFSDITSMKEHQSQLEQLAHYDALTGLPNRVLLADRLQQAMSQSQRRAQSLAVAYLDLDGFKVINDKHGHSHGDKLLVALSERMKEALRDGDTLARIGGDEFVAVLVDLEQPADHEAVMQRLLKAAAEPLLVDDLTLQVSASVGVTLYPRDQADADLLIRHADQAMYVAKQAGKNRYHLFDIAQDAQIQTRHENLERVRKALQCKEFVLHYQPKIDMKTGKVMGAEALIRWQHPERGLLAPAAFLPLIENDPITVELGEWVIGTALAQMGTWKTGGLDIPVSLNISARQLQEGNFPRRLTTLLLAQPEIQPNHLELEVLETSALEDIAQVSEVMRACQALGVRFALDDFGTGYSSLTYLRRLPAEVLKIDRSFVRDMINDPDDMAIVQGIVGLAAAFRREVIAEGVETAAHGNLLLSMGCTMAQGYGIALPMPATEMADWVARWHSHPVWTG